MAPTTDAQLADTVVRYAALIKARVTPASLHRDVLESPYYPTLRCISGAFTKYNIPNKAFKITAAQLDRLRPPFVAWIATPGAANDFVIVTRMTPGEVTYEHGSDDRQIMSRDMFASSFRDVVWLAEPNDQSGEQDYERKLRREKQDSYKQAALALSALFVLAIAVYAGSPPRWMWAPIVLKLTGLVTGMILLSYEVNKDNRLMHNICSHADGRNGCNAVMGSNKARIMGVSLGELVFFYFAGTTLIALAPYLVPASQAWWLAVLNVCAMPFVAFSIYYQWRVVRQWCRLCMVVAGLLLAELASFATLYWQVVYAPTKELPQLLIVFACAVAPVALWYWLKPLLLRAKSSDDHRTAWMRLKNDPALFALKLAQQPPIYDGWQQHGIKIGDPAGANNITIISDPYCMPCAYAHKQLHELMLLNNTIHAHILFYNEADEHDKGGQVAMHLLALAAQQADVSQALHTWYMSRNYATWAQRNPVNITGKQQQQLMAMHAWCVTANVPYTPLIYVNGRRLPTGYEIADLAGLF